jgi:hypothetical protein
MSDDQALFFSESFRWFLAGLALSLVGALFRWRAR